MTDKLSENSVLHNEQHVLFNEDHDLHIAHHFPISSHRILQATQNVDVSAIRCRITIIIFLLFIVTGTFITAPSAFSQEANAPLELPEFIITGKESVNIPGGTKQPPSRPPLLKNEKLDSINPVGKLPLPPLPPRPLPTYATQSAYWPGFVDAYVGNYLTPGFAAGYSFRQSGYMVDFGGDFEASNGWVTNSDYTRFSIGASSAYVAPEKFIFFGGSTTEVDIGLDNKSYKLYADAAAPSRSVTSVQAKVGTEGRYSGISYDAGIGWNMNTVVTNRSVSDNVIRGHVSAENRWNKFDVGALLDLRLQTFDTRAYPFTEVAGTARYILDALSVSARVGLQWATSTTAIDRFGFALGGLANINLNKNFTVFASFKSGLRPLTFQDLVVANRYVSDSMEIDIPYDVFDVGASIAFHPAMRISSRAGLSIRRTDHEPVWIKSVSGTFAPDYRTVSVVKVDADVRWLVSASDAVVADIHITNSAVTGAKKTPYIPVLESSVGYDRSWVQGIKSIVSMVFYGERFADLANEIILGGYVDLRIGAEYSINNSVSINVKVDNLLGSTIFLWEGYRERGVFIKGGLTWKF